eukprot:354778-Chlamydomonas_euryale.AAC.3
MQSSRMAATRASVSTRTRGQTNHGNTSPPNTRTHRRRLFRNREQQGSNRPVEIPALTRLRGMKRKEGVPQGDHVPHPLPASVLGPGSAASVQVGTSLGVQLTSQPLTSPQACPAVNKIAKHRSAAR